MAASVGGEDGTGGGVPSLPPALQRSILAVRARVRLQRALEASAALLVVSLTLGTAWLLLRRLGHSIGDDAVVLSLLLCLPALGAALGALCTLPPLLAPRLLDRAQGTNDLFASAYAFAGLPAATRTPFMQACVTSAENAVARVQPASASPLVAPQALRVAAALLLGFAALVLLPQRAAPPAPAPEAPPRKPQLLQAEDVSLASAEITPLLPALAEDPALAPLRDELNALMEALEDERLERAEALLALRALEDRLAVDELADDQRALDEAMKELGKQLASGGPEQSLADALAQADAEQARQQAEQLAKQLGSEVSKQKEAALERALRKASEPSSGSERAREELQRKRDSLFKQKSREQAESPEQQQLLKKKERELDQLQREQEQRDRAERQLDELRRELGDSARSMSQGNEQDAQQHMQRGAQSLQKLAHKKLSAEQRKALAQKLQQLRELISKQRGRQGGQNGEPQAGDGSQRLDVARFGKLARGQGQSPGGDQGEGQGGQQKGDGMLLVPGQGSGGGDPLMLSEGDGPQALSARDDPAARGGSRAGLGGSPQLQDEPTERSGKTVDTRVRGELGEGPTRSEVIHEAGQRGFASLPYQKVHAEYARHAERMLERDHVPGGYKFYVRRYFQLIRPREDAP